MLYSLIRNPQFLLLTIIVAASLIDVQTALAFERGPKKKVHETLTVMAFDCLKKFSEVKPTNCLKSPKDFKDDKLLYRNDMEFINLELGKVTARELAKGVKWPDDPTNEVGFKTIFKFGIKLLRQCEKRFDGGLKDGLLCSSHYGPLQFWHGMAIPNEETKQTQRKMLGWAEFLYEVAVNDEYSNNTKLLDTDHCKYWKDQTNNLHKGALKEIFAPENKFPCNEDGPGWKIHSLFSMECNNPFSSIYCTVNPNPRDTRIKAIGALLHMIQDSFAQGHNDRGSVDINPKNKRILSKFECQPINQFYVYVGQSRKKHGQADAFPEPGKSCFAGSSKIDDPITASAKALWFIRGKKGASALLKYLEYEVFDLAQDHQPSPDAGQEFRKN